MTTIQSAIHQSITEKGAMQKKLSVLITHAKFLGKLKKLAEQNRLKCALAQFRGTDQWYRHTLGLLYTDGVEYLAEKAGAYWLIDLVASVQGTFFRSLHRDLWRFQAWELKVNDFNRAVIVCTDGNGRQLYSQDIPFTDFPLDEIKLYCTDNVLLLPSEY